MDYIMPFIFCFFLLLQLVTVFVSKRNEKKLLSIGAKEYGKHNSKRLVITHFVYYAACFLEGFCLGNPFHGWFAQIGVYIYMFAIFMLYYVIYQIRHVWTLKLIIAPSSLHWINRSFLFRTVKHPNYYLSILPELISLPMVLDAPLTFFMGIPIYFLFLEQRISLEEEIMEHSELD